MARYQVITLVDITRTHASRYETDKTKLGQQANFNALQQAIGLRSNFSFLSDPLQQAGQLPRDLEGKATYWTWNFERALDLTYKEHAIMATTAERLGVVETKVANLDEKLDEIKVDVKDMHDCLDKTRDSVMAKLEDMYGASCQQHSELASKITELEKFRQKWIYMTAGGVAVLGWVSGHMDLVAKIFN